MESKAVQRAIGFALVFGKGIVAAGFMPAFNHQNKFLFEFERGLEARGYE
jgi:hypothetical protein